METRTQTVESFKMIQDALWNTLHSRSTEEGRNKVYQRLKHLDDIGTSLGLNLAGDTERGTAEGNERSFDKLFINVREG